jgi:CheY-like chemotaxis protein
MDNEAKKQFIILLIENDESDVFIFRRALGTAGFDARVRVVGSATEARAYIENAPPYADRDYYESPALIVSDFRLSGHTAMEFVRWLRSSPFANIRIVIMSGAATPSQHEQLSELGASGFVGKTGDVSSLAITLRKVLPKAMGEV